MREPVWLSRPLCDALHADLLRQHGGASGIRDENALESALSRPFNKLAYQPDSGSAELATAYGFGLARNHPYNDGNKRIAFIAMYVFLGLNGWEIEASEEELVQVMLSVASGRSGEKELAEWLREHMARSSF